MRGPPDLKCERAPLAGRPISQNQFPYTQDSSDAARDVQALKLRRLYSFCHATACTIASLAFAVSR
jgi:hypothetical protein